MTDEEKVLEIIFDDKARWHHLPGVAASYAIAALGHMADADWREMVRERIEDGLELCGPLDAVGDERDWMREAMEELADALIYLACEVLRRRAK